MQSSRKFVPRCQMKNIGLNNDLPQIKHQAIIQINNVLVMLCVSRQHVN